MQLAKIEAAHEARGPRCPLRERCQLLLTDLQRDPLSEWFRGAEWRALGAAYLRGVGSGRGIDLDEVQVRMDAGAYVAEEEFSADAFAADVGVIWQNALDFNGEASKVGVVAKLMQACFERRMANVRAAPCLAAAGGGRKRAKLLRVAEARANLDPKRANIMAGFVEQVCPAAVKRELDSEKRAALKQDLPDQDHVWVTVDVDALDEDACAQVLALYDEALRR